MFKFFNDVFNSACTQEKNENNTIYVCQKALMINSDSTTYTEDYFSRVANIITEQRIIFLSEDAALKQLLDGKLVIHKATVPLDAIKSIEGDRVTLDTSKPIACEDIQGVYLPKSTYCFRDNLFILNPASTLAKNNSCCHVKSDVSSSCFIS